MSNIVDFRNGNARTKRSVPVTQGEARILFFTGVRYFRESEATTSSFSRETALIAAGPEPVHHFGSETALDVTAH